MLIVHLEDEVPVAEMLRLALMTLEPELKVKCFPDWEAAVGYIDRSLADIDLFILDIHLSGQLDGIQAARKLREMGSVVPIFLTSSYGKPPQMVFDELKCTWIPKPWFMVKITQQMITAVKESYAKRDQRPPRIDSDDKTIAVQENVTGRTRQLSTDFLRRVAEEYKATTEGGTPLGHHQELILEIRGMVEHRVITENFSLTLGRSDPSKSYSPDIDLSLYSPPDSAMSTISRMHVRFFVKEENLYVTDLTSTNGTFLRGERLRPHTPTPVYMGDDLVLGQLSVKVWFR